jgi:sugar phosphate isomerase/epimerase
MKLGAITESISQDLEYALSTMKRDGLGYAELQFVYGIEAGSHTDEQNRKMKELLEKYGIQVSVIMRHNFNGMTAQSIEIGDAVYNAQIEGIRKSIALAQLLGAKLVRTMTCSKANVIWGSHGAENWVSGGNKTWGKLLKLMEKPVQMVEDAGLTLVMETGTGTLVGNTYLAKQLIDDLGTKHFKVLWDPDNCLYNHEPPFPDAYYEIRDYLAHIHIKDMRAQRRKFAMDFTAVGRGELAPYLEELAGALRKDRYEGVVSLENCYIPDNGTLEDGYNMSLKTFKEIFA